MTGISSTRRTCKLKSQLRATKITTAKGKRIYASKRRSDALKQELVRDATGGWADWRPRRDTGVFANERSTYRHNGEVKWL